MSVFHDGSCSFKSFSNIPDLNSAANRNGCIALGGAQSSRCQTTTMDVGGSKMNIRGDLVSTGPTRN